MADDGDRRSNPPPLPSTYVTLVQLQERWIQEIQRKQREKEEREEQERQPKIQKEQEEEESEKRKRREEEEQQQQRRANLQKRPVQSSTTTTTDFPRRNNHHHPPLKSYVQYRAVRISDVESKRTDDLKKDWKMKGKPRADEEEDVVDEIPVVSGEKERVTSYKWKKLGKARVEEDLMRGVKEQLLHEKEGVVDEIPVVSTERGCCEKERVTSNRWKKRGSNKRGKARVEEDLAVDRECLSLEKEVETAENIVLVVSIEGRSGKGIGGKCEEMVPGSGGKRGNGSYHWGLKNGGNDKRVAEVNLVSIGREEMLPKKEVKAADVVPVVSMERSSGKEIGRKCEEEGVSAGGGKKGNWRYYRGVKNGGINKRVEEVDLVSIGSGEMLPKKEVEAAENVVPVVSTERRSSGKEIRRKCEEEGVSAGGGKMGNERYYRVVKNGGNNKRAEEVDLVSIDREEMLPKKEVKAAENVVPVVLTERRSSGKEIGRKCEEEGVSAGGGKKGNWRYYRGVKNGGNNKRVEEVDLVSIGSGEMLPKKEVEAAENVVPVVLTERRSSGKEIRRKCEEEGVSAGGGKMGNERYYRGVKNGGNDKRTEQVDLVSIGREEMLPKKEVEATENVVPMVSTERRSSGKEIRRKCEEEGVSAGGGKMGNVKYYSGVKIRGNDKRVGEEDLMSIGREEVLLKKEVEADNVTVVVSTERRSCGNEIGGKCEEEGGDSAGGGKKGNGRYHRGVKIRGNDKRVEEEDLVSIVREEVFPKEEVEVENVAVVISTEREGGGLEEGNGRNLMVNGCSVWEKKVVGGTVVDRSERVLALLGKCEGLSVRGGGGYGRNARNVNGAPGRYRLGYGRGSDRRLQRLRDSNLAWVRKEEGDTSDANVAGV